MPANGGDRRSKAGKLSGFFVRSKRRDDKHLVSSSFIRSSKGNPGSIGNTSTSESPVHTFAGAGTYLVVLTAVAGSESVTDEQSIAVSIPTGLGDSNFDAIQIYPNPTNGIVMINLNDHPGNTSVRIFDLKGSLVYSRDMHNPGLYLINISDYENGPYIMQLDNENQSSHQMIIKK